MVDVAENTGNRGDRKLRRWDWMVLPACGLLGVLLVAGVAELAARSKFQQSADVLENCLTRSSDPTQGVSAIPNSVCREKIAESKLAEFTFNSCGHRASMECGPKPKDTYRIVVVGSSMAMGEYVSLNQGLSELLGAHLSTETGHKIQVYNEAMIWRTPHSIDLRFRESLSATPNLILWILTPNDIQYADKVMPGADDPHAGRGMVQVHPGLHWSMVRELFGSFENHSRTLLALEHYLYENEDEYVKHYLLLGDTVGFLKTETDASWQDHLEQFAKYSADMESKARAIGVPFVVVLLPSRGQAAMLSMDKWPQGYDPYKLGNQVKAIIESEGGTYIDVLPRFRELPNAAQYYFPVDGHLNENGHVVIAKMLAKGLTSGTVPTLTVSSGSQAQLVSGR